MVLFNFGKKKEEKKTPTCCCGSAPQSEATAACCCGKIKSIKVLGAGCKSCHALLESTKEAVSRLDLAVDVEYITDMEKIMAYGVMSMPALVVNEKIVSMGSVLKSVDVEKLLKG